MVNQTCKPMTDPNCTTMTRELQVFEPVSRDNFDAYRYVLANRDLYYSFGYDEVLAERHLHDYGLKEHRKQITLDFLKSAGFADFLRNTMGPAILVFERATLDNFYAPSYVLANRDLESAFGDDKDLAERHLHEFGLQEHRRQVSAAFLKSQREKFLRFKASLLECNADCFPISFAKSLRQISEYDAESSNGTLSCWATELEANPNKLYADIGAGLRRIIWPNCAYVEVYPSITADILIDPDCKLPFRDASLDGIGCFAVLEHVNKPWVMAAEFARVVKPEGKIFIDWPFLQPVHGYPSHYYNATREGLHSLFDGEFDVEELYTGANQGADFTVSWILNALLSGITHDDVRLEFSQMTIADLCKQSPQSEMWKKVLGALDDHSVSMLSCGNTLVGIKK
jgi:SAM-dependent methyltransferase